MFWVLFKILSILWQVNLLNVKIAFREGNKPRSIEFLDKYMLINLFIINNMILINNLKQTGEKNVALGRP